MGGERYHRITRIIVILAAIAVIPAFAGAWQAHAGNGIATVIVKGGSTTTYSSFERMVDAVDDYNKKTVTIEMLKDWNAAGSDDFDRRLIIPSDSNVTLNMHGHVFSRNNSWDSGDQSSTGELIKVESDATLTVNGGDTEKEKAIAHPNVPVHTSTEANAVAKGRETFYGGLLCGGADTQGAGGIQANEYAVINLNDVTIAGCRSHNNHLTTLSGHGGGIFLRGTGQIVRMKNSRITGCSAACKGGAIYTKWFVELYETHTIELINSSIDHNYAHESGGGIYTGSDNTFVSGNGSSVISYNQSAESGGGIYENQEDTSISGFTMEGNKASKNGGAVYSSDEDVSLSGLKVKGNSAERGGGLYIENDDTTISGCEVTGNKASAGGGGVYVDSDVDEGFHVNGKTIVRDNSAGWGRNFYMSDNDPEDSRVNFDLASGSDVHVYYYNTDNKDSILVTEGKIADTIKSPDCTRFLTAENSGYCFGFRPEPSARKIVYKKGKRDPIPEATKISAEQAAPAKAGTVGAGGGAGSDFDLIKGYITHQKTDSATGDEDRNNVFYYSDALFYGGTDPQYTYNEHLATLSLNMAFSAMYLEEEAEEVDGDVYYNKHAAGRQFLADIGCPDNSIYINDSMARKPETDSIGVIVGSKKLKKADGTETGDILIPVTFRGGGYEKEWASNVTLGTAEEMAPGKEAKGFANAADQAIEVINLYLDNYNLREAYEQGKVKFWLAGYSRAGATTNLTSRRLIDQIQKDCTGEKKSQVFAYTCEAPKGGTDDAETEGNNYNCIHNMINTADVVPLVAPERMGFKRYGVDHYIPGDAAGSVTEKTRTVTRGGKNGVTQVTTRSDNTAMRTKGAKENDAESKAYNAARNEMVKQLALLDHEVGFDDYFHPMYMSFPSVNMKETGSYDNSREEDFLYDFLTFFMEGMNYKEADHWSQAVCNRDRWLEPWGMNGKFYSSIQDSLRDAMVLVFGMPSDEMGSFTSRAMTIKSQIPTLTGTATDMLDVYRKVIGDWHERTPAEKETWTTYFWERLEKTGALDILNQTDRANLQKDWPTIMGMLLHFTDGDYNYHPGQIGQSWAGGSDERMMYLTTFAIFSGYIMSNHYPEVNLAWARTYDDWYKGESKEYAVTAPEKVGVVSAWDKNNNQLEYYGDIPQVLVGDQKIRLDNEEINGEAIYYNLYETTGGGKITRTIATNQIYRGGVDLALGDDTLKYYRLQTYNMSRGTASQRVSYRITLRNARHKCIFETRDESGKDKTIENFYFEGQKVTTPDVVAEDQYFKYWTVSLLNEDGSVKKADITKKILGDNAVKAAASFTMPVVNLVEDSTFEDGYILKFTAIYGEKIKEATFSSPILVMEGVSLYKQIPAVFGSPNLQGMYDITWTYINRNGDVVPAPAGKAFNDTVYIATVRVTPDAARDIVFDSEVKVSVTDNWYTTPAFAEDVVKRNPADGSFTVKMEFPPTGHSDGADDQPEGQDVKLKIGAWDLNLNKFDEETDFIEYAVIPGQTVTITAPDAPNELFQKWNLDGTGIALTNMEGNELTNRTIMVDIPEDLADGTVIKAEYIPVIRQLEVNLYDKNNDPFRIEGGETGPDHVEAFVTISSVYEISPDNLQIAWSPDPGEDNRFDFRVRYEAEVSLKPDANGNVGIRIKDSGTDFRSVDPQFFFADNMKALVNGENDETIAYLEENQSVVKAYPDIQLKLSNPEVTEISDVSDVPHGATEEDVKNALQKTVVVALNDGSSREVPVKWTKAEPDKSADSLETIVWTVDGTLDLPPDISAATLIKVQAQVTVNEADSVMPPEASVPSGTYHANQVITLETREKGGTTYFTTNGEDPAEAGEKYTEGQQIEFNREDLEPDSDGKKSMTLKACTKKAGKQASNVMAYEYIFDNNFSVPEGEELVYNTKEQIGLSAGSYYTIEPVSDGVSIDAKGDAVAVEPGTYEVKLKLTDSDYRWIVPTEKFEDTAQEVNETEETETTTDDQTVSFTISKLDLAGAVITGIKGKAYTGKARVQKPVVKTADKAATLAKGVDYELSYENNVKTGIATVNITGTGKCCGAVSRTFTITVNSKLISAKAKKGKKAVIKWKKSKKVSGYQIRYSMKKNFSKSVKKVNVRWASVNKKTIKKLKAGKTYYVQVRSVHKVKDPNTGKKKTIYGKWSKSKKFKVKK